MHLLRVISPPAWTEGRVRVSRDDLPNKNKEKRFAAGGKVSLKARPRPPDSSSSSSSGSVNTSAVLAMEFTCGGRVLLVLHGNGAVTATSTAFSDSKPSHGSIEQEDGHRDAEERARERSRSRERERDVTVGNVTSLVCPPEQKDGTAEMPLPLPLPMVLATCSTALHSGHIFAVIRGNVAKIFKVSLPSPLDPTARSTGDH